jgi:hypothetical protein
MVFSQEGEHVDTQAIVAALDTEIARLQEVKALLAASTATALTGVLKRGPGRPKSAATVVAPKKRVLNPEARERIAAAQKARWAKVRRAAKRAAKAEAGKGDRGY